MKEINVKVKEINIAEETYFVYVYEQKYITKFYIQQKDYGIIRFAIGLDLNKLGKTIEDFINENIIDWIYFYKSDMEGE